MNPVRRTVDGALFASTDPPRLAGARCPVCGTVVFPAQDGCPRCSHQAMSADELPAQGVLWSWTVQQFQPKPPFRAPAAGWAPVAIGYVDLGEVIVEGWLVPADREWRIGEQVHVTTVRAWSDDAGDVWTYAFEARAGEPA